MTARTPSHKVGQAHHRGSELRGPGAAAQGTTSLSAGSLSGRNIPHPWLRPNGDLKYTDFTDINLREYAWVSSPVRGNELILQAAARGPGGRSGATAAPVRSGGAALLLGTACLLSAHRESGSGREVIRRCPWITYHSQMSMNNLPIPACQHNAVEGTTPKMCRVSMIHLCMNQDWSYKNSHDWLGLRKEVSLVVSLSKSVLGNNCWGKKTMTKWSEESTK